MKKTFMVCALSLTLLWLAAGSANAQVTCPATNDTQWVALLNSSPQQATFIRTTQDLNDYVAGARFVGHPLNGLTAQELSDFLATIWIKDGGVVSMNASIPQSKLSPASFATVLAAFGISKDLYEDHEGYKCDSPHNCVVAAAYICMTGC
ncbi:MAG: hypothetical protein KBD01_18305 [Acidobacteria bacterium]|nr:hypothetical protein [Acidobacteriota bacterium]